MESKSGRRQWVRRSQVGSAVLVAWVNLRRDPFTRQQAEEAMAKEGMYAPSVGPALSRLLRAGLLEARVIHAPGQRARYGPYQKTSIWAVDAAEKVVSQSGSVVGDAPTPFTAEAKARFETVIATVEACGHAFVAEEISKQSGYNQAVVERILRRCWLGMGLAREKLTRQGIVYRYEGGNLKRAYGQGKLLEPLVPKDTLKRRPLAPPLPTPQKQFVPARRQQPAPAPSLMPGGIPPLDLPASVPQDEWVTVYRAADKLVDMVRERDLQIAQLRDRVKYLAGKAQHLHVEIGRQKEIVDEHHRLRGVTLRKLREMGLMK